MNHRFTAMTFNLRVDVEVDGKNFWPRRVKSVLTIIHKHRPDFLATQEVTDRMLQDLELPLNCYQAYGDGRNADRHGERCTLFVRKDHWKIDHSETVWLSATPTIPGSMDPEEGFPRICTMVVASSLRDDSKLLVVNVHLSYRSARSLDQNITTLLAYLSEWRVKYPYPVILLGDFNANPSHPIHERIKAIGLLSPLDNRSGTIKNTFHDFLGGKGIETIDYIYYTPDLSLFSYYVDQSKIGERYPSDHFPVVADFIVK